MNSAKTIRTMMRVGFVLGAMAAATVNADASTQTETLDPAGTAEVADTKAETAGSAREADLRKSRARNVEPEAVGFFQRLFPKSLAVGPQAGIAAARFRSSREYEAYTQPTAASRDAWVAPTYGLLATVRWRSGITLTLAPRHESYGIETREETVSFKDNPFPHTLRSSTELGYNVWPLLLGWGWFGGRQHAQLQIGTYTAFLDDAKTEWIVDGEPYRQRPNVEVKPSHAGWMIASEYGYRVGSGELLVGIELQRSSETLMNGLEGSIISNAARIQLGYLWTLAGR